MSLFDEEKSRILSEIKEKDRLTRLAEEQKSQLQRRLDKLEKVQDWVEPAPGTVIRFSRPLAGSQKYTFVLVKIGTHEKSWYVTGSDNSLNLLGLSNKGSTWREVLLAIGDNKAKVATVWKDPADAEFDRFESEIAQWRVRRSDKRVEYRRPRTVFGTVEPWTVVHSVTPDELERESDSPISSLRKVSEFSVPTR
jgi:hypothetical protein